MTTISCWENPETLITWSRDLKTTSSRMESSAHVSRGQMTLIEWLIKFFEIMEFYTFPINFTGP